MLGMMFPGSSMHDVQDTGWRDHGVDIPASLTSVAIVLDENPAQDEKLRQYFTLFLHHLRISLNHFYRARESEVWYDLHRRLEGKTMVWTLLRLAKHFFKPAPSGSPNPEKELSHRKHLVSMLRATKCLHMLLLNDSPFYEVSRRFDLEQTEQPVQGDQSELTQEYINRFLVQSAVEGVNRFCPRKWPACERPSDGHCGFRDDDAREIRA
ncbi:hypothetical protein CPB86DRAFT_816862 [Serendipita vermifera]|nr:hypothetical protein CPB86DRAFT_816862 [Serendipita vermifera]